MYNLPRCRHVQFWMCWGLIVLQQLNRVLVGCSIVIGRRQYCKTLFFRCILIHDFLMLKICRILIWRTFRFLNLWSKFRSLLLFSYYQEYCISHHGNVDILCTETYSDEQLKNSRIFNFMILLKSWKSQKFDAHELLVFYNIVNEPDGRLPLLSAKPVVIFWAILALLPLGQCQITQVWITCPKILRIEPSICWSHKSET